MGKQMPLPQRDSQALGLGLCAGRGGQLAGPRRLQTVAGNPQTFLRGPGRAGRAGAALLPPPPPSSPGWGLHACPPPQTVTPGRAGAFGCTVAPRSDACTAKAPGSRPGPVSHRSAPTRLPWVSTHPPRPPQASSTSSLRWRGAGRRRGAWRVPFCLSQSSRGARHCVQTPLCGQVWVGRGAGLPPGIGAPACGWLGPAALPAPAGPPRAGAHASGWATFSAAGACPRARGPHGLPPRDLCWSDSEVASRRAGRRPPPLLPAAPPAPPPKALNVESAQHRGFLSLVITPFCPHPWAPPTACWGPGGLRPSHAAGTGWALAGSSLAAALCLEERASPGGRQVGRWVLCPGAAATNRHEPDGAKRRAFVPSQSAPRVPFRGPGLCGPGALGCPSLLSGTLVIGFGIPPKPRLMSSREP